MGKHLLSLEAEARSHIALHEDRTIEATETIMGLAESPSSVLALPCSHLTYLMPLGFPTQLPSPTPDFLSPLPYSALPISRLLFTPTLSLCTDYASSSYDFWYQLIHIWDTLANTFNGSIQAHIQTPSTQRKASVASLSGAQAISPILQLNLSSNPVSCSFLLAPTYDPSLPSHTGFTSCLADFCGCFDFSPPQGFCDLVPCPIFQRSYLSSSRK